MVKWFPQQGNSNKTELVGKAGGKQNQNDISANEPCYVIPWSEYQTKRRSGRRNR